MVRDGERGGQAGGADAAHRDVGLFRVDVDAVVVVLGGGAQSGVDGGDLLVEQCGQDAAALLAQLGQALGGGLRGLSVVEVLGGGSEEDVAVHGGCHQDALAEGCRDGQEDVPDQAPGELVEDDELAATRGDGEVVVAEPPVEGVGVETGRVDHPTGVEGTSRRALDALFHPAVEVQVHSVPDGLRGVGQRGGPGVDDALAGDLQRPQRAGAQVRLALVHLRRAEQPGLLVVVALGLLREAGQRGELLLVPGDEKGADRLDGDTRLGGELGQSARSLADEPRLQRAGDRVEPGVQDRRVGLRGALAHVVPRLDERDAQPRVAGEFAGDGTADHSGADDGHVVGRGGQRSGRGDRHAGVRSSRAATSVRKPARRSAASSGVMRGS